MTEVRRHVVRTAGMDVLLRRSGAGPAVVVCGPLSRSGTDVEPVRRALSEVSTAVSVDPPGRGLSDAIDDPSVPAAAAHIALALRIAGLAVDVVVGARGGAGLAAELAVALGSRRLVLYDSVLPDTSARAAWRERIAPDVLPRTDASHLLRHWAMRRDDELFRPWFDTSDEARLSTDLDDPEVLARVHDAVVDQLSAGSSWQVAHLAEVDHDATSAVDIARGRLEVVHAATVQDVVAVAAPAGAGAGPLVPGALPSSGSSRHIVETPWGEVLVRRHAGPPGGTARPLVLLHSSPGSGESLAPLAAALAATRIVLVPDTLGNGDSDAPRDPVVTIELLARVALAAVTALEPGEIDVQGAHTGAAIAIETALAEPDRVRHVVLDGIGLFSADDAADALAHHVVDVTPRWDGTHLVSSWATLLDGSRFFPWHRRSPAHRRPSPDPGIGHLQPAHAQMMRSGTSYPLSYRAAFTHATRDRLGLLETSAVAVGRRPGDVLDVHAERAAELVSGSVRLPLGAGPTTDAATIAAFLDS